MSNAMRLEPGALERVTAASVRVNLHRGMKLLRAKLGFEEGLHE